MVQIRQYCDRFLGFPTPGAEMDQPELPLPPPPLRPDQPYLPARMVNEFQYCPRLAYLEWVQGEWAESADTVEGRGVHRRVDRGPGALPEPKEIGDEDRIHARSVTLSSERLGLIAKLDLIEGEDGSLQPVDYKRGRRPHVSAGAWEPELVQLCVQGLILEDNGYSCSEGALYFRESRERVRVRFDDALRSKALAAVHGLRLVAAGGRIPPPLEDSPNARGARWSGSACPTRLTSFDMAPHHARSPSTSSWRSRFMSRRRRLVCASAVRRSSSRPRTTRRRRPG
jgi:CRISP-associated protein Cas1